MRLAYARGREARRAWREGLCWRYLNPYEYRSDEAEAWKRGWADQDESMTVLHAFLQPAEAA